jgi:hypothetical protein
LTGHDTKKSINDDTDSSVESIEDDDNGDLKLAMEISKRDHLLK